MTVACPTAHGGRAEPVSISQVQEGPGRGRGGTVRSVHPHAGARRALRSQERALTGHQSALISCGAVATGSSGTRERPLKPRPVQTREHQKARPLAKAWRIFTQVRSRPPPSPATLSPGTCPRNESRSLQTLVRVCSGTSGCQHPMPKLQTEVSQSALHTSLLSKTYVSTSFG